MSKTPLAYLATPYSKYPGGIVQAFIDAAALAARLLQSGVHVYCPIAHTHPLAIYGKLDPLDHSIWLPFDESMMSRCDTLIVAHMDGWQDSKGIAHEIEFFERAKKPIYDLPDIATCTMVRRHRQDAPDPCTIESARRRLKELDDEIAQATQWGGGLVAMEEERKSVRWFLEYVDLQERITKGEVADHQREGIV